MAYLYNQKVFTKLYPSTTRGSWNCIICKCNEILKIKKVYIIGDSDLKRINKRKFGKALGKVLIYFKCFSGGNTEHLNYYIVLTLVDETPQTLVILIGSNDITKMNYKRMNVQDLAQEMIDIALMCKSSN